MKLLERLGTGLRGAGSQIKKISDIASKELPKGSSKTERLLESVEKAPKERVHDDEALKNIVQARFAQGSDDPINSFIQLSSVLKGSEDLRAEYKNILSDVYKRTHTTIDNPVSSPIDMENDDDPLVKKTFDFAKKVYENSSKQVSEENLTNQVWFHFDSVTKQANTEALITDIKNYMEEAAVKKATKAQRNFLAGQFLKFNAKKYQALELNKKQIVALFDFFGPYKKKDPWASKKPNFIKRYKQLWKDLNLASQKKDVAVLIGGTVLGAVIKAQRWSYLPELLEGDQVNMDALYKGVGVNYAGDMIGITSQFKIDEIIEKMSQELNEDLMNSIFYQSADFLSDQIFAEKLQKIYAGQRGAKMMMIRTARDMVREAGLLASAPVYLGGMHPVLGLINAAATPLLYFGTKKLNDKSNSHYNDERQFIDAADAFTGPIASGVVEARTSVNVVENANKFRSLKDGEAHAWKSGAMTGRVISMVRSSLFALYQLVTVGTAGALAASGQVDPAVAASAWTYSNQSFNPMNNLIEFYSREAPRYDRDIQKMYDVLGDAVNLDTPDGEKEKQRTSFSELKNHNILIKGLNHSFVKKGRRGDEVTPILRDVNLGIKEGDFVTLKGESGGGKSTLIKLLARVFEPESGLLSIGGDFDIDENGRPTEIRDEGVDIEQLKKFGPLEDRFNANVVSCVQDEPIILKDGTLKQNILFRHVDKNIPDEHISELLKDLGLEDFADNLHDYGVQNMSGGEKRRVELARTLISSEINGKVLLLDEATSNLDPKTAEKVVKTIKKFQQRVKDQGKPPLTVICISHDDIVQKWSDKTINIYDINDMEAIETEKHDARMAKLAAKKK